ncbi:hypothetical protein SKAU_G00415820 [Synaphobranchus kaupii]|uniref:Uncharacterized protein n=1 Tax=Synaphobranchus kaupii TaxID=118154 RepID=A0A9Q1E7A0_SYNKA|nr:hypothetical protein SKAU_G00415820 [Synaphobranchus kaupii]
MLYGRQVWRIGRLREDWGVFSFQKLCADPGNMRPSIVLLEQMPAHTITPPPPKATHVSVGKALADTMPYALSTVGAEELEAGFVREEDSSPACQGPSKVCVHPL